MSLFAAFERGAGGFVLAGDYYEGDWYDDGGGDEEEKDYAKEDECPDGHAAAAAAAMVVLWRARAVGDGLGSGEVGFAVD